MVSNITFIFCIFTIRLSFDKISQYFIQFLNLNIRFAHCVIILPQSIGEVVVIKHAVAEKKMMVFARQSIEFFLELFRLRLKVFLLFFLYGLLTGIAVFLLQFLGIDFLAWIRGGGFFKL